MSEFTYIRALLVEVHNADGQDSMAKLTCLLSFSMRTALKMVVASDGASSLAKTLELSRGDGQPVRRVHIAHLTHLAARPAPARRHDFPFVEHAWRARMPIFRHHCIPHTSQTFSLRCGNTRCTIAFSQYDEWCTIYSHTHGTTCGHLVKRRGSRARSRRVYRMS